MRRLSGVAGRSRPRRRSWSVANAARSTCSRGIRRRVTCLSSRSSPSCRTSRRRSPALIARHESQSPSHGNVAGRKVRCLASWSYRTIAPRVVESRGSRRRSRRRFRRGRSSFADGLPTRIAPSPASYSCQMPHRGSSSPRQLQGSSNHPWSGAPSLTDATPLRADQWVDERPSGWHLPETRRSRRSKRRGAGHAARVRGTASCGVAGVQRGTARRRQPAGRWSSGGTEARPP